MNKYKARDLAERLALQYAERYGIVEYKIVEHEMIYYKSYMGEHKTYKVNVDLTTGMEKRKAMKYYYKPGSHVGKMYVIHG